MKKSINKNWALLCLLAVPFLMGSTDPLEPPFTSWKEYCPSECDKSATFTCTNITCHGVTVGDFAGGSEKFVKDPNQQFYACKKSTDLTKKCMAVAAQCGEFSSYYLPGCQGLRDGYRVGWQRGCN